MIRRRIARVQKVNCLKKISRLCILVLLFGLCLVPATSALETTTAPVNTSEEEPLPSLHLIHIDPAIKNSTYMYTLLIPTQLQKQNLLDRIDEYVVGNEDFKTMMKEYLQAIWEKYPVQFNDVSEQGNVITYITFAPEAYHSGCFVSAVQSADTMASSDRILTQEEQQELQLTSWIQLNSRREILSKSSSRSPEKSGFRSTREVSETPVNEPRLCERETWMLYLINHAMWTPFEADPPSRPPRWDWNTHKAFIDHAMIRFSIGDDYRTAAKAGSTAPDTWADQVTVPNWAYPNPITRSILQTFCDVTLSNYNHYYNPDLLTGVGGAPDSTKLWADLARDKADSDMDKYTYLGYASHFLTDVGNPEHTGMELSQYLNQPAHGYYENWVSGERSNLEYEMYNEDTYSKTTLPADMVKQNARFSHSYLDTVYNGIDKETNPSRWYDNATLKQQITDITKYCFHNTAYHTRSLVAYVMKKTDSVASVQERESDE